MEVLEKRLTYQDFKNWEFDENDPDWYELINGELVRKQSPTLRHQRISRKIERLLDAFALRTDSGEMLHAPLDVFLDDGNVYHPDVFFVKKDRDFIFDLKEQVVMGAPDVVFEILSKSTAAEDRGPKMENYEKYGVREYWLVDPQKRSIEVYGLVNQRYRLIQYAEETGKIKSQTLAGFEMEVAELFAD